MVEEHGRVLVTELAERFDVSEQTIRKDLLALERAHRLTRTHGGAISMTPDRPELAFDVRRRIEADAKRRIAVAAADFVHDGETIAFDASTTALEVARRLCEIGGWRELTVVTNGIRIAEELAGQDGITILMPGGNGMNFLVRAREEFPHMQRVLVTGYMKPEMLMRSVNEAALFRYLLKPVAITELVRVVQDAAKAHDLSASAV